MKEKRETIGYLREIIERYKSFLLDIDNLRGQLIQIFNLRDEIENLVGKLSEKGVDLSVERSKLDSLDQVIKDRAGSILKDVKKLVNIVSYREEQKIPASHWWWYLDEFLKKKKEAKQKKWLIRSGIAAGILISVYLIFQFVVPKPSPWVIYQEKGNKLLQEGDLNSALKNYKIAIQLAPKEAINYLMVGIIYEEKGMPLRAQSYFMDAKELYPHPLDFYIQRGMTYLQRGKFNKADKDANKALKINPKSAQAHFLLGNVYEAQSKIPLAVAEYQIVSQMKNADPKLIVISRYKMGMLMLQGATRSNPSKERSTSSKNK